MATESKRNVSPPPKSAAVDAALLRHLSGRDKIQALLKGRDYTYITFAARVLEHTGQPSSGEQVRDVLRGRRRYPHVREAIASEFGLSVEEVNEALDQPASAEA